MDILVKNGSYRNVPIINTNFKLVDGPKHGKKGLYITVENNAFSAGGDKIRVKIDNINDVTFTNGDSLVVEDEVEEYEEEVASDETDEEAMDRIAYRFQVLEQMTNACIRGDIRGLIVSGPPGVGKSFGVQEQLENDSILDTLAQNKIRYEFVKGASTALGLYAKLFEFSDPKNVLVFDDCDTIFFDDQALNILKAALDTSRDRRISWNSDSKMLKREGIPNSFTFKGTVIFITNLKFNNVRSKKLQDHLEALESRCHFLDLTIDTQRDKILRIKQVHRDAPNGLFGDYGFTNGEGEEILKYMEENQSKLREISIRMAIKLADLVKVNINDWQTLAVNTCMRRKQVVI